MTRLISESSPEESKTHLCKPDLSIVIVSYNTMQITKSCLESIFDCQSELKLQTIVIDNNSTDGSAEMVSNLFPNAILIKNSKNLGFSAANNQGFAYCESDFILLLNSDTLILGHVFRDCIAYLNSNPQIGMLGCRVLNPDKSVQRTCFSYPTLINLTFWATGLSRIPVWPLNRQIMSSWNRDTERDVDVVTGCFLLTRQCVIDEIGTLDENFFFFGEEADWCYRCNKAGWGVRFAPVGEIIHIGNASGKSHSFRRGLMLSNALVLFHRKNYGDLSAFMAKNLIRFYWLTRWGAYSLFLLFRHKDRKLVERRDKFAKVIRNFKIVDGSFKRIFDV